MPAQCLNDKEREMVPAVRRTERASSDNQSLSVVHWKLEELSPMGRVSLLPIDVVVILKSARFKQVRRKSLADRLRT